MKGAWVTLATNDSYSLGALVLAHSLRQVGTKQELAILVTPGVTKSMRTRLSEVFNLVKEVNVLDSRDQSNLRLLQRPELGITFTKLHCWQLVQYEKCVFLDADTLVLQNCDELFEREEFSAAPDVGWPDCFNSGVFVYKPSGETYDKLIQFALEKGSFDGGDQGLLNLYFSDWAHKDISKHLPFIYNVCSTAFYSYLPAFKQFGKGAKILHFIGNAKPWLQYFDTETRSVRPSGDVGHLSHILQKWWDIFCHMVHPNLSPDMSGLAGAFARLVLGQERTPEQEALESNLRRQNWEQGNIDYLGRDSFDNIWSKICETLSKGSEKEKTAEESPVVLPIGTGDSNAVVTEQQVETETQPSQGIVTAAETTKEESQAGDTKESSVAPVTAEEIDTSHREESVCALPISEKDSKVPLEVTNTLSSDLSSKTPTETPSAILTDNQVTKENDVSNSTSIQTEAPVGPTTPKEISEIAPISTTILQEKVSEQSQLPEKSIEILPNIPQAPAKLDEANQVISVSRKTSEPSESPCVPAKEETTPLVAVPSEPQSVDTAQPPIAGEGKTIVTAPVAETQSTPDVKDSCSIAPLTSPQTDSSQEKITTPDIPTPKSQTPLPASPLEDITSEKCVSPSVDNSLPTQVPSATQISPSKQNIPQEKSPLPVETSKQSQDPIAISPETATLSSTDKSVTAEPPRVVSPVETATTPAKPTDSSVQVESTSVTDTEPKESQTHKTHDTAASKHVPPEPKQAAPSPSPAVEACPIAPPPRKSGGSKKQGKSKK